MSLHDPQSLCGRLGRKFLLVLPGNETLNVSHHFQKQKIKPVVTTIIIIIIITQADPCSFENHLNCCAVREVDY
jgi:hypothetical protein